MGGVLRSHQDVIMTNRDFSYNTFARTVILYPPQNLRTKLPIYILKGLYLSVPFAFNQMDSRVTGSQTHLSIRMKDVTNHIDLGDWEVMLRNQENQTIRGVIDSVLVDDTMGEINIKYNIIDSDVSTPKERRSYL